MKLISFLRLGQTGFGAVTSDGLVDLTGRLDPSVTSIKHMLEKDLTAAADAYVAANGADLAASDITFLPVVPDPSKIICVGVNYKMHQAETGRPDVEHPTTFARYADSLIGHLQPLVKPTATERFDYEGELAVVIGNSGRNISEDAALDHIAGYACFNEGSVRNFQKHTSQFLPQGKRMKSLYKKIMELTRLIRAINVGNL